jgi:hypothetical protein
MEGTMYRSIGFLLLVVTLAAWSLGSQARSGLLRVQRNGSPADARAKAPCRPEIGYYIVAQAKLIAPDSVYVLGASNLPAGSVLTVSIYDYLGEGSRTFGQHDIAVGGQGVFRVTVGPQPHLAFRENMLCDVVFRAAPQPASVIEAVGRNGERLGTLGVNPEVGQYSGGQYLEDLTAVE